MKVTTVNGYRELEGDKVIIRISSQTGMKIFGFRNKYGIWFSSSHKEKVKLEQGYSQNEKF